jgi:O-acetyl-ADP-ribose deacetylase (regulator of RNase III)
MIKYVKGDATKPVGDGPKIIAHICNDSGRWGAGFVLAVNKLSPDPRDEYFDWYNAVTSSKLGFKFLPLGIVQYVPFDGDSNVVANMVSQHGTVSEYNPHPISYAALEYCLMDVASQADTMNASIHMPRIGCGLARGNWSVVESIIDKTLEDVDVTVYDL